MVDGELNVNFVGRCEVGYEERDGRCVEKTYRVFGTILLYNTVPLKNVQVSSPILGNTETNDSGRFEYSNIPNMTNTTIKLELDGYEFSSSAVIDVDINGSDISHNISARCAPGLERSGDHCVPMKFSIRGKVTFKTSSGTPLRFVSVATSGGFGAPKTNDKGEYWIFNVPSGTEVTFTPSSDRYVFRPPFQKITPTTENIANINFIAECGPGYEEISGSCSPKRSDIGGIVTLNGHPVSSAQVVTGTHPAQTTRDNGLFRFENLSQGTVLNLTARKEGYEFSNARATAGSEDILDVSITGQCLPEYVPVRGKCLQRFSVVGNIELESDISLEGVFIRTPYGTDETDEHGNYEIGDLIDETTITITPELEGHDFFPRSRQVTLASRDVTVNFAASCASGYEYVDKRCVSVLRKGHIVRFQSRGE